MEKVIKTTSIISIWTLYKQASEKIKNLKLKQMYAYDIHYQEPICFSI